MIQFITPKPDGGNIFFFGLVRENVQKLKEGKPLATSLSTLVPESDDEVVLFYGHTTADLLNALRKAGVEVGDIGGE